MTEPQDKAISEMTAGERADLQRSLDIIEDQVDPKILVRIDRLFVNHAIPQVLATLAKMNAKAIAMAARSGAGDSRTIGLIYLDYSCVVAAAMTFDDPKEKN